MLCQNCHKNEATIHIQQIVNGGAQSIHLCEECASKKVMDMPELQGFNLAEMLFNIAGKVADAVKDSADDEHVCEKKLVCPVCGWDSERFRKTGYVGCPDCYSAFAPVISGMLKNMHRGDKHLGKIPLFVSGPGRAGREIALLRREIEALRKEQELKIRAEDYEAAAVLRDRIQELERKIKVNGDGHDAGGPDQ